MELDDKVLIFDYFDGDMVEGMHFTGKLPSYESDTKIYMFASHKHQDHFDIDILRMAEQYENIHYILSKDIRISPNFLRKHGIDPKVRELLTEDYVLISLYVDEKEKLPERITVEENGQTRILRTVGDKWSYLQRVKFGANAQPFYVLLDNEGKPLNGSYSHDEDVDKYVKFLQTGLENYKKNK